MTFALLEGLKVLDLGIAAAGPYCAKLLADAGADVIHVERPGSGDPSRAYGPFAPDDPRHELSATFAFLNANKLSWLNGYAGGEPRRGTFPFTDHETVYHIAFIILAVLERRDRTGEGAWIDASQYEVGINMLGDAYVARGMGAEVPERTGNAEPGQAFSGCYPCDGPDAWITVSVQDRAAWVALCDLIGRRDLATAFEPCRRTVSEEERTTIDHAIRGWTAERPPERCLAEMQRRGIAAGVVNDIRDLLLDPQLAARDFFWLVEHDPEQAVGRRAWPGGSARLTATPARLHRHAPMLGEHNCTVLRDLLGYGEEEYDATATAGAVGAVPLVAGIRPPGRPTAERLDFGPWAAGRIKEYDAVFEKRLEQRFGPEFGSGRDGREQ